MATTAGELQMRMRWEKRRDIASDGRGNTKGIWELQFECWTRRMFLRGGEGVIAERLEGRQPGVLKVRQNPTTLTIDTDWRAVNADDATEVWNLRSRQPSEDNADIEFLAERGVASG